MLNFVDSGMQLNEKDIQLVEMKINRAIPSKFRGFLLEHNGARPDKLNFQMYNKNTKQEDWGSIGRFLGINIENTHTIEYCLKTFRNRIPKNIFPIARDPGGNLICLVTEGQNKEEICFWDSEFESETDEDTTDSNIYFIAENFDEFLRKLTG